MAPSPEWREAAEPRSGEAASAKRRRSGGEAAANRQRKPSGAQREHGGSGGGAGRHIAPEGGGVQPQSRFRGAACVGDGRGVVCARSVSLRLRVSAFSCGACSALGLFMPLPCARSVSLRLRVSAAAGGACSAVVLPPAPLCPCPRRVGSSVGREGWRQPQSLCSLALSRRPPPPCCALRARAKAKAPKPALACPKKAAPRLLAAPSVLD